MTDDVGLLVGCFHDSESDASYCAVRLLQYMDVTNEYDCPILTVSDLVHCIPSTSVCHSVSVIHQCTCTCNFITNVVPRRIEHENIHSSQLFYQHDLSNKLYCYNVYCMC